MGLRPAGPATKPSQSSSGCTRTQGTPTNEPEGALKETSSSPLTVDAGGQLRYFGYSSYMRMMSVIPRAKSSPTQPAKSSSGDRSSNIVEAEGLADNPQNQRHLIDLFFEYQNGAIPILDEEAFRLGSLNFDGKQPYRETLAIIYTRRAKAELLFELENPNIATIPGLCLFGYYLAGLGSDRACWLYPGIAYRLVFDFGLHEDCNNLVAAGLLTGIDQRVRQITLYGCYVLDKLYSSYQGRPTAIHLDDLHVPQFSAHTMGTSYQLMAAWVELASILNDVLSMINGSLARIYQDTSVSKLSKASQKLLVWFNKLPPKLQWNADHPISPGVCALHVQFLSTTILLNRPFAAYIFNRDTKSASRRCLEGQTPKSSQQLCTTNAIRISKLLLAYKQYHGASKIFSTINPACLSASVALISDITSAGPGEAKIEERKWLGAILETLQDIIKWYPIAERSLDTLAAVMNTCGLSSILKQLAKNSGDAQVEPLSDNGITEVAGTNWNFDADLSFGLGSLFDPLYDVHNLGLPGIYAQPLQMMDFGGWDLQDSINNAQFNS
ncbi:uncharacterized protein N7511_001063 [Penicillium nucicola]|uniref:uncharacterized protein n=1 Tax=Penicillium nucicola TaxID=1850975 RepID=UPI002545A12E|nr:uncharacterized protein N7511_001063 [Penicillium nucicola]KAJ5776052.1 hypothetical protein N7511_001063 [Penicillium nucicola]